MNKIIEKGVYWRCDNMDLLASIVEEGVAILLDDNSIKYIKDDELKDYNVASKEEYKEFYHKRGSIFLGDEVVVIKGRKYPKGMKGKVKRFFHYEVPGTYGHSYTDYVVLEDGNSVSIQNVRVVGFESLDSVHEFKPTYIGGRI